MATPETGPIVALPPIATFQALDPLDLKIYLFLATLADDSAHITLPATHIARALGLSPRRAQYALTALRKHNLLTPVGYGQHAHLRITRYALSCVAPHAQPCVVSPPHAPSCVVPHAPLCVDPSFSDAKTAIDTPESPNITKCPDTPDDPLHAIAQGLKQLAARDPNELLGAITAIESILQQLIADAAAKLQQNLTPA